MGSDQQRQPARYSPDARRLAQQVEELARDVRALQRRDVLDVLDATEQLYRVPLVIAYPTQPRAVLCLRAVDLDDTTATTTPGGVSWRWDGAVQIDAVDGLSAGVKYRLLFGVIP